MKSFIVTVLACFISITISAQESVESSTVIENKDTCNTESIQSVIDACLLLAQSSETGDTVALRQAKEAMEACNIGSFAHLRPKNRGENESLEGHLIFNVAFADSLANGKDAYKNSDSISRTSTHRGQMQPGQILTKTCFVKANGKSVYTFPSHDRQELAVVAEPGGLVTTRVHVVNKTKEIDEWHNDIADVAKGRNSRKTAFNLPNKPMSQVTLEIINCTSKDISVVVISN